MRFLLHHTLTFAWINFLNILSGLETAQAFWNLLLPHGLAGGALERSAKQDDDEDEDEDMDVGETTGASSADGWKEEYLQWWFDFLNEKGGKGVTKDTWVMVCTLQLAFIILHLRVTSTYSFHFITKVLCLYPLD